MYLLPVTCVEEVRLKWGRATLEGNLQNRRMSSILFLTSYYVANLIFHCFYDHKCVLSTIFVYWYNCLLIVFMYSYYCINAINCSSSRNFTLHKTECRYLIRRNRENYSIFWEWIMNLILFRLFSSNFL